MYNISKELEEAEVEQKAFEIKNAAYQNDIARKLSIGGLGDEIRQTLNNPVKITKFKLFKIKVKNFIKNIIDVL